MKSPKIDGEGYDPQYVSEGRMDTLMLPSCTAG
jgi:hypothetical protein